MKGHPPSSVLPTDLSFFSYSPPSRNAWGQEGAMAENEIHGAGADPQISTQVKVDVWQYTYRNGQTVDIASTEDSSYKKENLIKSDH